MLPLVEQWPGCPGCEALDLQALHLIENSDRLVPTPCLVLRGCQTCGQVFIKPRPTPDVLDAFYNGVEPLISDYPMYSSTFESLDAFELIRHRELQQLLFDSAGGDVSERMHAIKSVPDNLTDAVEEIASGEKVREQVMISLRGVRSEHQTRVRIRDVRLPDAGLGFR